MENVSNRITCIRMTASSRRFDYKYHVARLFNAIVFMPSIKEPATKLQSNIHDNKYPTHGPWNVRIELGVRRNFRVKVHGVSELRTSDTLPINEI